MFTSQGICWFMEVFHHQTFVKRSKLIDTNQIMISSCIRYFSSDKQLWTGLNRLASEYGWICGRMFNILEFHYYIWNHYEKCKVQPCIDLVICKMCLKFDNLVKIKLFCTVRILVVCLVLNNVNFIWGRM